MGKYGYARVSTAGQAKHGNSLEEQERQLRKAGAEKIFSEAYTGTTTNRPQIEALLHTLKEGDTLLITKLDRIARSVSQGSELIDRLLQRGVKVKILNMGDFTIDNSPTGKLIRHIFMSFAEFERDMIVERTQEGRHSSGNLGGRPRIARKRIAHALSLLQTMTYNEVSAQTGISKSTLQRAKRRADAEYVGKK